MIGQVGNSEKAADFLKRIKAKTEIADMVYCTSGRRRSHT